MEPRGCGTLSQALKSPSLMWMRNHCASVLKVVNSSCSLSPVAAPERCSHTPLSLPALAVGVPSLLRMCIKATRSLLSNEDGASLTLEDLKCLPQDLIEKIDAESWIQGNRTGSSETAEKVEKSRCGVQ